MGDYGNGWLTEPAFLIGIVVFFVGWTANRHADLVLLRLRNDGESGYRIPHGGLYRFISCPNYLGEMLQWTGWAIATWSLAGMAFAIFTIANLLPRALSNHRWYRQHFKDYPVERRAIIPYLL
jgi:steroid 5-alpha reductase family enzyme